MRARTLAPLCLILLAGCADRRASEPKPIVPITSVSSPTSGATTDASAEASDAAADATELPVLVKNRFVDPRTGTVVGELAGADRYRGAFPVAGEPGHYRSGGRKADAARRAFVDAIEDEYRYDSGAVVRVDEAGHAVWRQALSGRLGSVRPPDLVKAEGVVIAVADDTLVALARKDGRVVWRKQSLVDRLLSTRDGLVLATDCQSPSYPPARRLVIARRVEDGSLAFETTIPQSIDPLPLEEVADLVKVTGDHVTWLLDHVGRVVTRLAENADVTPLGADLLVIGEKRIARIKRDGSAVWERTGFRERFVAGSGVVTLPGGDLLAFNYGRISDSGVELARIRPDDGAELWRAHAAALGVAHSVYQHEAYVELRGKDLVVVSQGAYGDFVEVRDASTGASLARHVVK
jgi:hypothetical protein